MDASVICVREGFDGERLRWAEGETFACGLRVWTILHTHTRPVHDNRDSNRGLPLDNDGYGALQLPAEKTKAHRVQPSLSLES